MAAPATVLDLSTWKVTLPIPNPNDKSKPLEVKGPAILIFESKPYFTTLNNCAVFRAPVNGITTSGSKNPRSELREMNKDGSKASWDTDDGDEHKLEGEMAFTALPTGKPELVGAQIHDGENDVTVFRLEGNKLYVTKGNDNHYKLIDDNYQLGTVFTFAFVVIDGLIVAFYNGKPVADIQGNYEECFFKAGAYTQANCSNVGKGNCRSDNFGETAIFKLKVSHGKATVPTPVLNPPPADFQGVGGAITPPGAILATADSTSPLKITKPGVYDGQGKKVGRISIRTSNVVVQNYRVVANSQYAFEFDGDDITIQNNDIKGVKPSGDGDLNAFTGFGDRIKILRNTAVDFVSGNPGGSHTDFIQTWVSSSHPKASKDWQIVGNKAIGPANPKRDPKVPSIHQWLMVEGAGRGGNSGGSGKPSGWLIADNEIGDSWNQAIKLDGVADFTITRNKFVGSSSRVIEVTTASTGVKFYDDNIISGKYGQIGTTVLPRPTDPNPVPPVPPVKDITLLILRHFEKPGVGGSTTGVQIDGKANSHSLIPAGWVRAGALMERYKHSVIDGFYASKGDSKSNRPLESIYFLALMKRMPINTDYDFEDLDDMRLLVRHVLGRAGGIYVLSIEHSAAADLVKALSGINAPEMEDRYDRLWVLERKNNTWMFSKANLGLMPADAK